MPVISLHELECPHCKSKKFYIPGKSTRTQTPTEVWSEDSLVVCGQCGQRGCAKDFLPQADPLTSR